MVDSLRHKDWLEKAKMDIKSAEVLKEHDCGNDVVAFHCQQAIEKSLKAFLIFRKNGVVEGHSLIFLCKEVIKYDSIFKKYIKDCAFVNQYYIETRYPSDTPLIVTNEEAEECINIARSIFQDVNNIIN